MTNEPHGHTPCHPSTIHPPSARLAAQVAFDDITIMDGARAGAARRRLNDGSFQIRMALDITGYHHIFTRVVDIVSHASSRVVTARLFVFAPRAIAAEARASNIAENSAPQRKAKQSVPQCFRVRANARAARLPRFRSGVFEKKSY